jgi:hypothetical protein
MVYFCLEEDLLVFDFYLLGCNSQMFKSGLAFFVRQKRVKDT